MLVSAMRCLIYRRARASNANEAGTHEAIITFC